MNAADWAELGGVREAGVTRDETEREVGGRVEGGGGGKERGGGTVGAALSNKRKQRSA